MGPGRRGPDGGTIGALVSLPGVERLETEPPSGGEVKRQKGYKKRGLLKVMLVSHPVRPQHSRGVACSRRLDSPRRLASVFPSPPFPRDTPLGPTMASSLPGVPHAAAIESVAG